MLNPQILFTAIFLPNTKVFIIWIPLVTNLLEFNFQIYGTKDTVEIKMCMT